MSSAPSVITEDFQDSLDATMDLSASEAGHTSLLAAIEATVRSQYGAIPAEHVLRRCVLSFGPAHQMVRSEAERNSLNTPALSGDSAESIDWHFSDAAPGYEPTVLPESEFRSETSDTSTIHPAQPAPTMHMNLPFRSTHPPPPPPPAAPVKKPRNPHQRADGLTDVCGVFSPGRNEPPTQRISPVTGANKYCPRCFSTFTRPRTVKDHFPGCIDKYGNPLKLKYTDHASMKGAEDRRIQIMRNTGYEADDMMTDEGEDERMEGWVEEQLAIKQEAGYDTGAPIDDVPRHERSIGSPSHLGDGLSDYMDRYPEKGTTRSSSPSGDDDMMED